MKKIVSILLVIGLLSGCSLNSSKIASPLEGCWKNTTSTIGTGYLCVLEDEISFLSFFEKEESTEDTIVLNTYGGSDKLDRAEGTYILKDDSFDFILNKVFSENSENVEYFETNWSLSEDKNQLTLAVLRHLGGDFGGELMMMIGTDLVIDDTKIIFEKVDLKNLNASVQLKKMTNYNEWADNYYKEGNTIEPIYEVVFEKKLADILIEPVNEMVFDKAKMHLSKQEGGNNLMMEKKQTADAVNSLFGQMGMTDRLTVIDSYDRAWGSNRIEGNREEENMFLSFYGTFEKNQFIRQIKIDSYVHREGKEYYNSCLLNYDTLEQIVEDDENKTAAANNEYMYVCGAKEIETATELKENIEKYSLELALNVDRWKSYLIY